MQTKTRGQGDVFQFTLKISVGTWKLLLVTWKCYNGTSKCFQEQGKISWCTWKVYSDTRKAEDLMVVNKCQL